MNLPDFDDSQWSLGPGGFGYGDNDDATTVSSCISVSIRITIKIPDINEIVMAVPNIDYYDAFIAWLNGVEITHSVGLQGANVNWNTHSSGNHETVMCTGGKPTDFLIKKSYLQAY